jgi:hypothetical protein
MACFGAWQAFPDEVYHLYFLLSFFLTSITGRYRAKIKARNELLYLLKGSCNPYWLPIPV